MKCKNAWFSVFNGFTPSGLSWTRFHYFYQLSVCVSACVWYKFCSYASSKQNEQNCTKLYIQLYLKISWCWLYFFHVIFFFYVLRNFRFLQHSGIGQNCLQLYLMPIILSQSMKFQTFIYNNNSKIIHTVCIREENAGK